MRSKLIVTFMFVFALLSMPVLAQKKAKVQKNPPGIAIGKKAPDFELKDQKGRLRKLSTLLKDGPVAVVFHRSANW